MYHLLLELTLVFNTKLPTSVYQLLLNTLPEYRLTIISIEDMVGLSFNNSTLTIKEMDSGCYLCPRKDEVGSHHYCMDGCFNLSRRSNAGKLHKLTTLKGMVRSRELFDTFVSTEESKSCQTVKYINDHQTNVSLIYSIHIREHHAQHSVLLNVNRRASI